MSMVEIKREQFIGLDRILVEEMPGEAQPSSKLARSPSSNSDMIMVKVVVGCQHQGSAIRSGDLAFVESGVVAAGNKRQFFGRSVYLCPISHVIAYCPQWS